MKVTVPDHSTVTGRPAVIAKLLHDAGIYKDQLSTAVEKAIVADEAAIKAIMALANTGTIIVEEL